ncbi:MAG: hypothetical protein HZB92_04985 [Euryarchaeota archaeon]|nr:hypothetical protein [Euryarchaeota archaeon]
MNNLSNSVLRIMEESPLGRMSIYVLRKQSMDAGIDIEEMRSEDLPALVTRLKDVLPFFLGEGYGGIIMKIKKLNGNQGGS